MNDLVKSIRSENWAAIIRERQESGQTVKQWCAENNLSEAAYYYRLRQLREKLLRSMQEPENNNASSAPPVFVKVPDAVTAPAGQA